MIQRYDLDMPIAFRGKEQHFIRQVRGHFFATV